MTHNPEKRHNRMMLAAGAMLCVTVGLGVGLIIGFLTDAPNDAPLGQEPRSDRRAEFIKAVDASKIRMNLRELTRKPHVAGTPSDLETAEVLKKKWEVNGIEEVYLVPYKVLLQYPPEEESRANRAQIIDPDGTVVFESDLKSAHLGEEELMQDGIPAPYNAYSGTGDVTGDLVYVNYCTLDDINDLRTTLLPGVNLTNKIFLCRYGGTGRSTKVLNAQTAGAAALILYSDPEQYSVDPAIGLPYPDGPFLPQTAVQRGSIFKGVGDPLTPGYPSTDWAYRLDEDEAGLPTIPVHPINFKNAADLLRRLTGPQPPPQWRGKLDGVSYQVGPGFHGEDTGRSVRVVVNSFSEQRTAYNVIGFIHGEIEPDRYVIIGNHRDAWGLGSVDPTSGTACLLEISRVLGDMMKSGWKPRRSIVFASWGAEEFGMIGSVEWTEEYYQVLSNRAVAYLNLDIAVAGNWEFNPSASPHMSPVMVEAMKNVMEPNPSYPDQTILDSFLDRKNISRGMEHLESKIIRKIGAGSDYYGFLYGVGVPCLSGYYYFDSEKYPTSFYSLYHTQYETFRLMEEFVDPGFVYHRVVSQLFGDMLLNLAESELIQANVTNYMSHIWMYYSIGLNITSYRQRIEGRGLSLEALRDALAEFYTTTEYFHGTVLPSVDRSNPLALRAVNDKIMMLERAFLDRHGLPGQPNERHLIFASATSQNVPYDTTFPGIADAIENIGEHNEEEGWKEVERQISILTHIIHGASSILKENGNWTETMMVRWR